jgi:chemotaxis protein CheD
MSEATTNVAMGELEVSADSGVTLSTFVGSCVALCLYDPAAKIGGMAHIMLPEGNNSEGNSANEAKYANQAFENTLKMMAAKGALQRRMVAKIAGGAKVFSHDGAESMFNIGARNAEAVKGLLEKSGIKLLAEDIGSSTGRWVKLDVGTGRVLVSTRKTGEKTL